MIDLVVSEKRHKERHPTFELDLARCPDFVCILISLLRKSINHLVAAVVNS